MAERWQSRWTTSIKGCVCVASMAGPTPSRAEPCEGEPKCARLCAAARCGGQFAAGFRSPASRVSTDGAACQLAFRRSCRQLLLQNAQSVAYQSRGALLGRHLNRTSINQQQHNWYHAQHCCLKCARRAPVHNDVRLASMPRSRAHQLRMQANCITPGDCHVAGPALLKAQSSSPQRHKKALTCASIYLATRRVSITDSCTSKQYKCRLHLCSTGF